eukprot:gnl/TRDRNA2_/TRDRNA2_37044_c0_seq1.p1 gnl/TRDRNA2_/TRDRNA2_37044_c0~~gnl/TRDRNA2_/TRDRNA2_37044_c0_seq1.p1  ORF type:complete len:645 (-),score=118.27 gnl/TRDRNA2_/TRDRNA2_37044_c0_seq1:32-1966(-)
MTQQGVTELQRNVLLRMLSLSAAGQEQEETSNWKVLVYDKFCQEVVAPLLKVGSLRNRGVTLHLSLLQERLPVADVPAVYFVEPTEVNIQRICDDLAKGLYESCFINFASAVPRYLLEELAKGAVRANAAHKVAAVVDRYVSFVSLSSSIFSLNLPAAYETLHSPSVADHVIQQYIERIVDGLLSVLITMRVMPIIRCPPNEVAEMVGRRLEERIRELLKSTGGAELFAGTTGPRPGGAASDAAGAAGQARPLLCILDRDLDLITMLHHTWTYQAMAHDVLGMRLNRLTVPVESAGDGAAPPKPRSYDVEESDSFWAAHAGEPFPAVADAVHQAIEAFHKKRESMASSGDSTDPTCVLAPGLAAAINALPEMTEKKRCIDMHTNIATALLGEIKARELDRYYELEDQFTSQSSSASAKELEQLLGEAQKGTQMDKARALMVLYLSKPTLAPAQLESLAETLAANGGDVSGLRYLQHLASIRNMTAPSLAAGPASSPAASTLMGGALGGLADRVRSTGEGLLAKGVTNLKNILPSKKELLICQVLDALMEQKASAATDNYIYLDPKATGADAPRQRAPFRTAIAFTVGGGNYVELQSLQEWAQARGRNIVYGSTDLVSPTNFAEELAHLGMTIGGRGGGGEADLR